MKQLSFEMNLIPELWDHPNSYAGKMEMKKDSEALEGVYFG